MLFDKILIANRGEIAVRVMKTCREMGIGTVAVYSDADRLALHVLTADEAVYLGENEPSQSYLNIPKLLDAARQTGAQAVHPGYGFLAENAGFSQACEDAGLAFIGPPAQVIRDLGDKTVARRIMSKSGVPVIPGMNDPSTDAGLFAETAERLGYPVLVKAAAGGGGKGMRVVEAPQDLAEACATARSEAAAAFGCGDIFLEKAIINPRHVEFQILADKHGNAIHLLERECSIQRRHQKIIEETPSVALDPDLRERMGKAAVAAAKASGYENAGTVEFLVDKDGNFYFLEVNTRLQVEHPITEMVTGFDLVRRQILVAAGEKLDIRQQDVQGRGHAIECRIYGEDPENGFFPSPGRITYMKEPAGPGIRHDCGVYQGFEVPVEYDPILSKLVVHAETREQAIQKMILALQDLVVIGPKTPIAFLMDVLASEPFAAGETFTNFIEAHFPDWKPSEVHSNAALLAWLADELLPKAGAMAPAEQARTFQGPFHTLGNWRMVS